MYIFFAVLAIILIFLFIKFKLTVAYLKNEGEKFNYTVILSFFNGKCKIKLSPSGKSKKNKEIQKNNTDESEEDEKLIEKLKNYSEVFLNVKKTYEKQRFFIQKRLRAEEIEVFIKFGLSDAMQTGIATGVIWAFLYQSLALFSCIGTVEKHSFDVVPVFDQKGFCSSGKGIFSVRLINIIGIALRCFLTYVSVCRKAKSK